MRASVRFSLHVVQFAMLRHAAWVGGLERTQGAMVWLLSCVYTLVHTHVVCSDYLQKKHPTV